jgi:hypothetical protein
MNNEARINTLVDAGITLPQDIEERWLDIPAHAPSLTFEEVLDHFHRRHALVGEHVDRGAVLTQRQYWELVCCKPGAPERPGEGERPYVHGPLTPKGRRRPLREVAP